MTINCRQGSRLVLFRGGRKPQGEVSQARKSKKRASQRRKSPRRKSPIATERILGGGNSPLPPPLIENPDCRGYEYRQIFSISNNYLM